MLRRACLLLFVFVACKAKPPKEGDVCKIEEEDTAICSDPTTSLVCRASKRVAVPCRGPKGCTSDGHGHTSCDLSVGREGDACGFPGNSETFFCNEEKNAVLQCTGHLTLEMRCRGPKGCDPTQPNKPDYKGPACDRTLGEVGDACSTRHPGRDEHELGACSVDGKRRLACDEEYKKGSFVVSRVCPCKVAFLGGDKDIPFAKCELVPVAAGDPCAKDDRTRCTADPGTLLQCNQAVGKWVATPCGAKQRCVDERAGSIATCESVSAR